MQSVGNPVNSINVSSDNIHGFALLDNDVIYTNLLFVLELPWGVHIPQGHHVTATPQDLNHWAWVILFSEKH